jgi:hypothetical protein
VCGRPDVRWESQPPGTRSLGPRSRRAAGVVAAERTTSQAAALHGMREWRRCARTSTCGAAPRRLDLGSRYREECRSEPKRLGCAMTVVTVESIVQRPPRVVFDFVAKHHFENHPRWDPDAGKQIARPPQDWPASIRCRSLGIEGPSQGHADSKPRRSAERSRRSPATSPGQYLPGRRRVASPGPHARRRLVGRRKKIGQPDLLPRSTARSEMVRVREDAPPVGRHQQVIGRLAVPDHVTVAVQRMPPHGREGGRLP